MRGVFNLGVNQNITYFQHTFVRVKLSSETHVYIPAEYNNFDRRVHSIGQHAVILTLKIFFFQTNLHSYSISYFISQQCQNHNVQ